MANGDDSPPPTHLQRADRFCVWCGSEPPPGSRFCVACGRFITDGSSLPVDTHDVSAPGPMVGAGEFERDRVEGSRWPSLSPVLVTARDSRSLLVIAAVLAVMLAIGVAGLFVVPSLRERPVNEALKAVQTSFETSMRQLETADALEAVRSVASDLERSLPAWRAREASLARSNTELGRASRRVVLAQITYAESVAQLAEVSNEGFSWWGPLHTNLVEANARINAGRRALGAVREESGAAVSRGDAGLSHLETVIGGEVAGAARSNLSALLQDLAAAPRTVAIRELASSAALEGAALDVSSSALLKESPEGRRMAIYAAAYRQVGGLDIIDGDHLDAWAALRGPLLESLAAVDADLPRMSVGAGAVSNVDRVVRRASDTLESWQRRFDAAVSERADDLAGLRSYRTKMDAQLRTYSSLRGELSRWLDRVEAPDSYVPYSEAYDVLSQATFDRRQVRDEMNTLDKPAEVADLHQNLIAVIDAGIAGVQAAYEGASDAQFCVTSCFYRDTPGWRRFRADSAQITRTYGVAVESWRDRVDRVEVFISNQKLPSKPVV